MATFAQTNRADFRKIGMKIFWPFLLWIVFAFLMRGLFEYQYFWYPSKEKFEALNSIFMISLLVSVALNVSRPIRPFAMFPMPIAFVTPFFLGLHQIISIELILIVVGLSGLYFLILRKANSEELFE